MATILTTLQLNRYRGSLSTHGIVAIAAIEPVPRGSQRYCTQPYIIPLLGQR